MNGIILPQILAKQVKARQKSREKTHKALLSRPYSVKQGAIAKEAGLSQSVVSRFEADKTSSTDESVAKIAQALIKLGIKIV